MTTARTARLRRSLVPMVELAGAGALVLTGCSAGGGGSEGSGDGASEFTYLSLTENTAVADILTGLSTGA